MATTRKSTLLDLVLAVSEYAISDDEVVATVAYLINSGKVLLCGNFAGAKIDLATRADTTPRRPRRGASGPAPSATRRPPVYVFPA
jgi:hypothetical protein